MRKLLRIGALIGLLAVASGCSLKRSPVLNTVDLSKIDFSNSASMKEGSACATYILGVLGPIGDPSVFRAIQNSKIKSVKAVDYQSGWYLLFTQDCVVVYGE